MSTPERAAGIREAADVDMPGAATPGMHRRPDTTTTTTDREGAEPMTEITRADSSDQTHETETWTEQQMRSDFMHAEHYNLRCQEDYDPADELAHREYSSRWTDGEQQWADEWQYLSDATDRWTDDYAAAQRRLDFHQRAGWLTPTELRSEQQARDIANHGIECDEYGLLSSPYVTRVQDRADSETATPSPLANHRPGNALAAHQANSERDGIER